jgi:hypothetical protein
MKHVNNSLFCFCLFFMFVSCKKSDFLAANPDKSQTVPETIEAFQSILDNSYEMNDNLAILGEIGADNYVYFDGAFNAESSQKKNLYLWNDDIWENAVMQYSWSYPYRTVFNANVIIEGLNKLPLNSKNQLDFKNAMGSALFYRAHVFYLLSQLFSPSYSSETSSSQLGIPLRLKADINEKIIRVSLKDSYAQIISDLMEAKVLLPIVPKYKNRPSIPASSGLLARVYLSMGAYDSAFKYSNECLSYRNTLIDFNTIPDFTSNPFEQYNEEVIFPGRFGFDNFMPVYDDQAKAVDTGLINSYHQDDLRLSVFYENNSFGGKYFKGSYEGFNGLFGGIAIDEIFLIRAECYARLNDKESALKDLNTLMMKRWKNTVPYPIITAHDSKEALNLIIQERRKELAFRGLRWTDLRRLNANGENIVLTRSFEGITYTLLPNDKRYTYLIPPEVLSFNPEMKQNPR